MSAFRYRAESDEFATLWTKTEKDKALLDAHEAGEGPMASGWKPMKLKKAGSGPYGDLSDVNGFYPCFSERAWDALNSLIGGFVKALPVIHPAGGSWFLINVTHFADALDEAKSTFRRNSNGRITGISKHAFIQAVVLNNPIFRIRQDPMEVFFTQEFLDIVKKEKLTGLAFFR